jgi:hypothetical protein
MYLKAKDSLHTSQISSFKYVFIVFFEKSDAKIYIFSSKVGSAQIKNNMFILEKLV